MKLTYLEKLFIAAYNENGGNGTQAYLSIKPMFQDMLQLYPQSGC